MLLLFTIIYLFDTCQAVRFLHLCTFYHVLTVKNNNLVMEAEPQNPQICLVQIQRIYCLSRAHIQPLTQDKCLWAGIIFKIYA